MHFFPSFFFSSSSSPSSFYSAENVRAAAINFNVKSIAFECEARDICIKQILVPLGVSCRFNGGGNGHATNICVSGDV